MSGHRAKVKLGRKSKLYNLLREKGINDFKYVQIASCLVHNFDEQRMFEEMFIQKLKPTLNACRAFATEDDRKESNRRSKQRPEYKEKQLRRARIKDSINNVIKNR